MRFTLFNSPPPYNWNIVGSSVKRLYLIVSHEEKKENPPPPPRIFELSLHCLSFLKTSQGAGVVVIVW
jgi:hypothetical protein